MQTTGNGKPADTVRSAVAALNDGDIDGYLRYFDPSCQRWVAGLGRPLDGSRGRRRLHDEILIWDSPSRRSTSEVDTETCEIYETAGGIVVTTWTYGDSGARAGQKQAAQDSVQPALGGQAAAAIHAPPPGRRLRARSCDLA